MALGQRQRHCLRLCEVTLEGLTRKLRIVHRGGRKPLPEEEEDSFANISGGKVYNMWRASEETHKNNEQISPCGLTNPSHTSPYLKSGLHVRFVNDTDGIGDDDGILTPLSITKHTPHRHHTCTLCLDEKEIGGR